MQTHALALLLTVGVAGAWAQETDGNLDPAELEAFCQRVFPGTHWQPETARCASDWNGEFDQPEGSLFDVWPLGFERKPEDLAFDRDLIGRKYLQIHHENPGWDPTQGPMLWEIFFFREDGFLERRLFPQPPLEWDDDSIRGEILARWETGTWVGESYRGAPMMRIVPYSYTTAVRNVVGFTVPQFHFYDGRSDGMLAFSDGMTLKLPFGREGDDRSPPPSINFQVLEEIGTQAGSPTMVATRTWGTVKAGSNVSPTH
jgi:hypothetical protein